MDFAKQAGQLSAAGREFYGRGWALGTSGNFSAAVSRRPLTLCITASGNDKGALGEADFLEVGANAEPLRGAGRPSAETVLHLAIYQTLENAGSVLHTHSVWGTILSDLCFERGAIEIEGYEMLKGLSGVKTHEHRETVPIVENSQDYDALARDVENALLRAGPEVHGVYLRRHGLYTWGADVAEARRHVEVFEFLFEVLGRSSKLIYG